MRLIDADALKKLVAGWACFIREDCDTMWTGGIEEAIDNLPTVEERKTGKWLITDAYPHNVHCSECYKRFAQTHWEVWKDGSLPRKYCPNCGARMEK